jgi:outer membrane biogenesis lipoprotein LolB
MRTAARLLFAGAAALLLAACTEPSQDPARTYAGKEDTKAYAGDAFKGDKAKWEATLAKRADSQNEYIRTGDAKK